MWQWSLSCNVRIFLAADGHGNVVGINVVVVFVRQSHTCVVIWQNITVPVLRLVQLMVCRPETTNRLLLSHALELTRVYRNPPSSGCQALLKKLDLCFGRFKLRRRR